MLPPHVVQAFSLRRIFNPPRPLSTHLPDSMCPGTACHLRTLHLEKEPTLNKYDVWAVVGVIILNASETTTSWTRPSLHAIPSGAFLTNSKVSRAYSPVNAELFADIGYCTYSRPQYCSGISLASPAAARRLDRLTRLMRLLYSARSAARTSRAAAVTRSSHSRVPTAATRARAAHQ
jgi:hypothetical protein